MDLHLNGANPEKELAMELSLASVGSGSSAFDRTKQNFAVFQYFRLQRYVLFLFELTG